MRPSVRYRNTEPKPFHHLRKGKREKAKTTHRAMLIRRLASMRPMAAAGRRAVASAHCVRMAPVLQYALLQQHAPTCALSRSFSTDQNQKIIFKSPHPKLHIPQKTIWEVVEEQVLKNGNGDRNAFICGVTHEKVTFKQLYERSKRLAVALAKDGVRKDSVVIVHSSNCLEFPVVVLALNALGAVCSTASPMFLPYELAVQISAANATHIITNKDLEDVAIEAALENEIDLKYVYTMGKSSKGLTSVNDLAEQDNGPFVYEKVDPELKSLLPFSSGTTGVPKGVALSSRNMIANTLQVDHVEKLGDHSLGLLPFFHIYGLMMMHLSLYQGTAKVLMPRFDPEVFLNALETYKIRAAHIAPPVALFLAHHPMVEKYDISATKFLVSGGAPMGKEVEALVKERLNVTVKQAYGMTEASPAVNYSEDDFRKPGTVGRLVANTELRVRCTATGVDLPAGERGELLYRGPQVMIGYSNNEEANKTSLTEDGFLCTGDIGYIDDDGCVFVVDRVKELIKYKGHQVAPAELEDVLNNHPEILDSCCVRGADAFGDELPKAFVVLKDKANPNKISEEDVMNFVAERVAPFKKVRQVEFIDAIPKNASGKLLRRQLQERENQLHD